MPSDRNLLFGVLALHLNLISRDIFITAMKAWVLNKANSIVDVLREQRAMGVEALALLDALVEQILTKHDGDPGKSLLSLCHSTGIRDDLLRLGDQDVEASLGHLALDGSTIDHVPSGTNAADLRYCVLRPHARGGLGEVFVALDRELHREVALKEILSARVADPTSKSRFLLEAEINGRLEHPNIVPVYGLGQYADGRPFYAMRMIQGVTLHEAIRTFHEDVSGRASGAQGLSLHQLLARFVAVCNAAAYAHSRGVIHRDIKPGNVMLGTFGETLLMDWGLAKFVGDKDGKLADSEPILMPSPGNDPETVTGTAIGTPAYMSPEQATGRLDLVGPASDIYGLGATFYFLLTGQPPFKDKDIGRLLQQVSKGQWSAPGHIKKRIPRALDAICRKAMALRPKDRYATALELATDVERWVADQPVSAYRESLPQRLARWGRRHRPSVAFVTAILVAACGFFLWLKQDADSRTAEADRVVLLALDEFDRHAKDDRLVDAKVSLQRAEGRILSAASEQTRRRLKQSQADFDMVLKLEELLLQNLQIGDQDGGRDVEYAAAFRTYGLHILTQDGREAAKRIQASAIRTQLVAGLYDWTWVIPYKDTIASAKIWNVIWLAETDPWRHKVLVLAQKKDGAALEKLVDQRELLSQPPATLVMLGRVLVSQRAARENLLRQAQRRYPGSFWLNNDLAECLSGKVGHHDEAIGFFRAALAARPQSPGAHFHLATRLMLAPGKNAEAEAILRRAIELNQTFGVAHWMLGVLLSAQGRFDEALVCGKKAHEVGIKHRGLEPAVLTFIKEAKKSLAEDQRLQAVFKGADRPVDASERLSLAKLCRVKKLNSAAARFYAEAFTEQPELAEDLKANHRYNAACVAVLAGLGKGHDASKLGDREKARWRQQALVWFKADLTLWTKRPPDERAKSEWPLQLAGWQFPTDLAWVRDEALLTKLPQAEREGWRGVWDEAAALFGMFDWNTLIKSRFAIQPAAGK